MHTYPLRALKWECILQGPARQGFAEGNFPFLVAYTTTDGKLLSVNTVRISVLTVVRMMLRWSSYFDTAPHMPLATFPKPVLSTPGSSACLTACRSQLLLLLPLSSTRPSPPALPLHFSSLTCVPAEGSPLCLHHSHSPTNALHRFSTMILPKCKNVLYSHSVALHCLRGKSQLWLRLALQSPASVNLDAPATWEVLPLLAHLLAPLSFQGSVPASLLIALSSLCPQEALNIPTSVSLARWQHCAAFPPLCRACAPSPLPGPWHHCSSLKPSTSQTWYLQQDGLPNVCETREQEQTCPPWELSLPYEHSSSFFPMQEGFRWF